MKNTDGPEERKDVKWSCQCPLTMDRKCHCVEIPGFTYLRQPRRLSLEMFRTHHSPAHEAVWASWKVSVRRKNSLQTNIQWSFYWLPAENGHKGWFFSTRSEKKIKGPDSIFGFTGRTVSVTTPQLCFCNIKATLDST